jgi:outer membrane protein OmpA-like peptidoglycan-associated protein
MKKFIPPLVLLVLAGLGIAIYTLLKPALDKKRELSITDAQNAESVRIDGDGYTGYWFLTQSPEMKKQSNRAGLSIDFSEVDDFKTRYERLKKGESDMMLMPISSFIEQAAIAGDTETDIPGVVVCAIVESINADAIIGDVETFPQGNVSELNRPDIDIYFPQGTVSEFLVNLGIHSFDLYNLSGSKSWRMEMESDKDVYDAAIRGKKGAFVVWEPYVSMLLNKPDQFRLILGSGSFRGYIIDVLVINKDYLRRKESSVLKLLEIYFRTLRMYQRDRPLLKEHLGDEVDLNRFDWFDLAQNCNEMFGLAPQGDFARDGLYDSIIACSKALLDRDIITFDPLKGNPDFILSSKLLETLQESSTELISSAQEAIIDFPKLSEAQWEKQKLIGMLKHEQITFGAGSFTLTKESQRSLEDIVNQVSRHYDPNLLIEVRGHTLNVGGQEANQLLSEKRAQAVRKFFINSGGLDENRIRAIGFGSSVPREERPGESSRVARRLQARVEIYLREGPRL